MERRKIIIEEIAHWRRSKVLPEQYCDFLMNLYQEDHSEAATASWQTVSKTSIRNSHWRFWLILCLALVLASIIVFNFNQFPLPMQIGLALCITALSYYLGLVKLRSNKTLSYATLGSGSIFMLWIGQYVMTLHDVEHAFWFIGYFVLCSVLWIVFGIIFKIGLFQFCGWMGIIMFYGWLLHARIDQIHWLHIQLFWLPLTVIFVWLGWLLHHRNKSLGKVYFLVGLLLWFVPDVYLILFTNHASAWLQFSFISKIVVAALLLFIFRKKWIEWVA